MLENTGVVKEVGAATLIRRGTFFWRDPGQCSSGLKQVGFLWDALHDKIARDNTEAATAFLLEGGPPARRALPGPFGSVLIPLRLGNLLAGDSGRPTQGK